MGFFDKAYDVVKSYDPTTKKGLENIGMTVATGGASVPFNVAVEGVGGGDASNLDWTKVGRADPAAMRDQASIMRNRQADLLKQQGQYTAGRQSPRAAQMQEMPRGLVREARALPVAYQAQPVGAEIGPIDTAQSQQAIEMARQQALGQGPSGAGLLMRQGMERNARQAMALAGARGYNPAALRQAEYQMSGAGQEAALEAAQLQAQQQLAGQQQFLTGAQTQQQLAQNVALQQAELSQRANEFAATQEGQVALAEADAQLAANLANQGVDLEILKSNAARGDTYALANLEAQLKQQGLDDAMTLAYLSQITGIDTNILNAEMGLIAGEEQRQRAIADARSKTAGGLLSGVGSVLGSAVGGN